MASLRRQQQRPGYYLSDSTDLHQQLLDYQAAAHTSFSLAQQAPLEDPAAGSFTVTTSGPVRASSPITGSPLQRTHPLMERSGIVSGLITASSSSSELSAWAAASPVRGAVPAPAAPPAAAPVDGACHPRPAAGLNEDAQQHVTPSWMLAVCFGGSGGAGSAAAAAAAGDSDGAKAGFVKRCHAVRRMVDGEPSEAQLQA